MGEAHLAKLAEAAFERHGDYEALFFEGSWFGTGELFERGRRLAGGLIELGIEPGDRVVVMMANTPDVTITYSALWRAGAAITPAIFLLPPAELRYILENSEARAIVTTPEFLPNVKIAAEGVETLKWIISAGPEEDGVIPLASLMEAEPASIVDRDDDDLAALMYTGGTTGRAKGVMLSHENLWFCSKGSHEASYVREANRTLVPIPLSHAFGLIVTVVGFRAEVRGMVVLQRWFEPQAMLQAIQEFGLHQATVVPSMVQILLGQPLEDHDLSSMKYLICGASPLSLDVAHEFQRRVPNVRIREGYGCTESGAVISTQPPDAIRLGSVGKPLPGYDVRILDDDGKEVPAGEPGEICCRAEGVMLGYWKAPDATAETLKDGWLHTGDIGRFDNDGYLYVVDRKKDLIIRGGFNVFPRDVEDALVEHPAVAIAGVVGRPDERKGEEVVAFVSLQPGAEATPEELILFAKERIGGYKYPREVHILAAVPLTPVGKIDRKQLRTMLQA
ncbi:MAG: class I adenylate-forming enzyme family protein [Actinomycetota bacterium]